MHLSHLLAKSLLTFIPGMSLSSGVTQIKYFAESSVSRITTIRCDRNYNQI